MAHQTRSANSLSSKYLCVETDEIHSVLVYQPSLAACKVLAVLGQNVSSLKSSTDDTHSVLVYQPSLAACEVLGQDVFPFKGAYDQHFHLSYFSAK